MKKLTKVLIFIIYIFISGILVGYCINEAYNIYSNHRYYNGVYINKNVSYPDAKNMAQSIDSFGYWVCVNIKGMSINDIIDTCEHEAAHELFARKCSNSIITCFDKFKVNNE